MPFKENYGHRNTRQRALTLVELTAVTVALAGLIGAALPSVRSAHDKSLEAGCRERLGKIAQAGLVYAVDDPSELAIPIGVGDTKSTEPYPAFYGYGGKGGLGPMLDANTSIFGGINVYLMGSPHRPLNTVLFKNPIPLPVETGGRGGPRRDWNEDARRDLDVYHCPADNGFPGMHYAGWKDSQLSGYDYMGTSYSANAFMIGSPTGGSRLDSAGPYVRPVSRIPNPANTVLYWESAARFAMIANNSDLDQSGYCWPWSIGDFTANGWHGVPFHFNVGFSDGHVAWTKVQGYGLTPISPFMPPSLTNISFGSCVQVRAPGWQLDAFPAELIPTWKNCNFCNFTDISASDGSDSFWSVTN